MSKKIKITIVGIGAVGGFYGALLAKEYFNTPDIEICFLARGENLKVIKDQGISILNGTQKFVVKPTTVTDNPKQIGVSDYVIIATKSYDLESAIKQIEPLVGNQTVILPLLNGVLAYPSLKNAFKQALVVNGCTYILSRLTQPGVVENPSGKQMIYFGLENKSDQRLVIFEQLLKKAGINAVLSNDIQTEVWKKYILVSSSAMATTYFNASFNQIIEKHGPEVEELLKEICSLAKALQINLPKGFIPTLMKSFKNNPPGSTTSMHSDFLAHKSVNELDIMGGYVVKQADALNLDLPLYRKIYTHLLGNQAQDYN
ncbi:ketopantoate reductase family protein [Myroides sp. LJL110]